ncbi:hypothetical protein LTR86_010790 [Recurvomyces mirabilis]|nr:hypothetical protein LTR86_010790 [Recurvomyces mirabilis]
MEVNLFFHHILLTLGYDVYLVGARVYKAATKTYGGWTHVVNLATIAEKKYMLDGGFGGNGPTGPVLLAHNAAAPQIAPSEMRLMHEPIPQCLDRGQKVWIYQYRNDYKTKWCFTETKFLLEDVESMNFAPMRNPQTLFTHKVLCCRFTTANEALNDGRGGPDSPPLPGSPGEFSMEGEIDGKITVYHDVLKWWRRGEKLVEIKFPNEAKKVLALRMYFGILISEDEERAILGSAAAVETPSAGLE